MTDHKTQMAFLIVALMVVSVLTFFIFKPFLYALIMALVFATIFSPVHRNVLALFRTKRGPAALFSTTFILVVVLVPVAFLGIQMLHESTTLYAYLASSEGTSVLSQGVTNALHSLRSFVPLPDSFVFDLNQYAKQGLAWILPHLGSFASNVASVALSGLIMLMALYYLFKDGNALKRIVVEWSPLDDKYDEAILQKLERAINSVIMGGLVVALVQGALCTIGFYLFGVPNAILWGSVAVFAALIPGFGTALVIAPAILFLMLLGHMPQAMGLLVWGGVAVGLIDNLLGPKLVERGVKVHTFVILLSILGGIAYFGPLGFILGPLTLSLLYALIEIYFLINEEKNL